MKNGIELITEERKRQINVEQWTSEHDDEHEFGEMAMAAACYAAAPEKALRRIPYNSGYIFRDIWPWGAEWDKRFDFDEDGETLPITETKRLRNLVKAGALIAAEIDRLQRIQKLGKDEA